MSDEKLREEAAKESTRDLAAYLMARAEIAKERGTGQRDAYLREAAFEEYGEPVSLAKDEP